MRRVIMTLVAGSVLLVSAAPAAPPDAPVSFIKADELKALLDRGTRADIIDAFRRRNRQLADYKRISAYVLWDREFPRTASQKIKRDPLARELKPLGRALALRDL